MQDELIIIMIMVAMEIIKMIASNGEVESGCLQLTDFVFTTL